MIYDQMAKAKAKQQVAIEVRKTASWVLQLFLNTETLNHGYTYMCIADQNL